MVWLLKKENNNSVASEADHSEDLNITDTYKLLLKIFKLPAIQLTVLVLLTCKVNLSISNLVNFNNGLIFQIFSLNNISIFFQIGFSASDSVTGLKLVEIGVPKAQLALLAVPLVPLQIVLPLLISRYTAGPKPMEIFLKAMPCR